MNKPIREGLATADTSKELEAIGLMIQNQASDIPDGEKKVLEMLFYAKCDQIQVPVDVYNKTMKALGSKAERFVQFSTKIRRKGK